MNQFKVGDICVGVGHVKDTHRNGVECEIVGGLENRLCGEFGDAKFFECYLVAWADEWKSTPSVQLQTALHQKLRRKQTPQTFTGEQRIAQLFNVTITAGKVEV